MTITEYLLQFFRQYSALSGRIDVDFLADEAETFSLDTIPCEEVLKRYHDGSTRKQFQFAISSRRFYDQNIAQNIGNLRLFEELTEWVEQQSAGRLLPAMDGSREPLKIVVTSNAYPFSVTEDGKARYQMQLRFEYFQKRR